MSKILIIDASADLFEVAARHDRTTKKLSLH